MTPVWKSPNVKLIGAAVGISALALAGSVGVHAQTTVPPAAPDQPQTRPYRAPSPTTQRPGSTSETLGHAHGVLPPPHTGDSNVIPPQNSSRAKTPDIAPPGTPGGNPNVVPK